MPDKKNPKPRLEKPVIKEVVLVPEEAVLGNCKSANGTNRVSGRCEEVANCQNKTVGT